jgi:tetratricopeptide (TPR) repeat protein
MLHSLVSQDSGLLGNWPRALDAAEAALERDHSLGAAYLGRAAALRRLDRFDEAITCLETGLTFNQTNPEFEKALRETAKAFPRARCVHQTPLCVHICVADSCSRHSRK